MILITDRNVEVFKTNIGNKEDAAMVMDLLLDFFPDARINFDLEDCDKILRLEGKFSFDKVIDIMHRHHYQCEILE